MVDVLHLLRVGDCFAWDTGDINDNMVYAEVVEVRRAAGYTVHARCAGEDGDGGADFYTFDFLNAVSIVRLSRAQFDRARAAGWPDAADLSASIGGA